MVTGKGGFRATTWLFLGLTVTSGLASSACEPPPRRPPVAMIPVEPPKPPPPLPPVPPEPEEDPSANATPTDAGAKTVAPSDPAVEAAPPNDPELTVRLERSCTGNCPTYAVVLVRSGDVHWKGVSSVDTVGVKVDRVDPKRVSELRTLILASKFFSLKDDYASTANKGTAIVTVTSKGKTKTVRHALGAPGTAALVRIEDAIDRAAKTSRWISSSGQPKP